MEIGAINQSTQVLGIGSRISLKTTDPLHFTEKGEIAGAGDDDVAQSFSDMLSGMIGKTNDLQVESDGLTKKMIYEPESVNIHTVMIAQQKAEVALTFTKAVRDEAIRSYRELMNLR